MSEKKIEKNMVISSSFRIYDVKSDYITFNSLLPRFRYLSPVTFPTFAGRPPVSLLSNSDMIKSLSQFKTVERVGHSADWIEDTGLQA